MCFIPFHEIKNENFFFVFVFIPSPYHIIGGEVVACYALWHIFVDVQQVFVRTSCSIPTWVERISFSL